MSIARTPTSARTEKWRSQTRRHVDSDRWFHPRLEMLECRCLLSISTVVGRELFYDQSSYDGGAGIDSLDGSAIATDKSAYLPGDGLAVSANLSTYTRGINGIMIDLLGGGSHASINANDFVFKTGNDSSLGGWSTAAAPSSIAVITGTGVSSSDRVEIVWGAGAVKHAWLEVQVLATPNTGLAATDAFFWANLLGDSNVNFSTSGVDSSSVLANIGTPAPITSTRDHNRSGTITGTDSSAALSNVGTLTKIDIASAGPLLSAALSNDTGPGGVPNNDGITTDPTITGTLSAVNSVASFKAGINAGPINNNVTLSGGNFTLNTAFLQAMNGGTLPDGSYVVHLLAVDALGKTATQDVPFTLKHTIAAPVTPDLIADSDTGASIIDNITNDNTPSLDVTAEAGSTVTLYIDGVPTLQQVANPVAHFTTAALGDGVHSFQALAVDGAGNVSGLSSGLPVTINTVAPAVTLSSLVTFGDDLTPHITVTASDTPALADGTEIRVDVDVNNDGDFNDANETNRTLSTLYAGSRYFQITPALPTTEAVGGYLVQLRARVTDIAGNEGTSPLVSHTIDTRASTALADYINNGDATYSVTAAPTPTIAGVGYTVYVFDLRSQTWRTTADVASAQPTSPANGTAVWQHWLQIIVPTTVTKSTALLLINGGDNGAQPTTLSTDMTALGNLAIAEGMITVNLPTIPNQKLDFVFGDAPGVTRREDEIISYTFDRFVNTSDASWLALLPMVKSVVRAMDAVQAKDTTLPNGVNINDFILTGYSKRGWTTWLTGAVDSRVKAVIPGVIDLLNTDESFVHHYNYYGFFAEAVQDYQDFDLIQNTLEPANQEIGRIVDPYRYLFNSNLTNIPKLMLDSTGDEFFVPDSAQFYYSDIPGPKYIRYIPNTGHGLNATEVSNSTLTFTNAVLNNLALPQYSWTIDPDGAIRVTTPSSPTSVLVWQATNPSARDFRNTIGGVNQGIVWTSSSATNLGGGVYVGNVATPGTGARAFMIELTFASPIVGVPYKFTTEVRVVSNIPLVAWPYFMPANGPSPSADPAADFNGIAFSLAAPVVDESDASLVRSRQPVRRPVL